MISWPGNLPPKDIAVDLVPRPILGPPSITGSQQAVQSDAGCWQIQYFGVSVVETFRIRLWRVMAALLNGPATPLLVPTFDCCRLTPWPLDASGKKISRQAVPHSDGALFSDGSGYLSTLISVTADAAPIRATTLSITVTAIGELDGGEFFSIGENLYQIVTVSGTGPGYTITIMPPLREAIGNGTALNFDDPVCRCVLADTNGMPLVLQSRVIGRPNVTFIEDFAGA